MGRSRDPVLFLLRWVFVMKWVIEVLLNSSYFDLWAIDL